MPASQSFPVEFTLDLLFQLLWGLWLCLPPSPEVFNSQPAESGATPYYQISESTKQEENCFLTQEQWKNSPYPFYFEQHFEISSHQEVSIYPVFIFRLSPDTLFQLTDVTDDEQHRLMEGLPENAASNISTHITEAGEESSHANTGSEETCPICWEPFHSEIVRAAAYSQESSIRRVESSQSTSPTTGHSQPCTCWNNFLHLVRQLCRVRSTLDDDITPHQQTLSETSTANSGTMLTSQDNPDICIFLTTCGHLFHVSCLTLSFITSSSGNPLLCATCRTFLGFQYFAVLFDHLRHSGVTIPEDFANHFDELAVNRNCPPGAQNLAELFPEWPLFGQDSWLTDWMDEAPSNNPNIVPILAQLKQFFTEMVRLRTPERFHEISIENENKFWKDILDHFLNNPMANLELFCQIIILSIKKSLERHSVALHAPHEITRIRHLLTCLATLRENPVVISSLVNTEHIALDIYLLTSWEQLTTETFPPDTTLLTNIIYRNAEWDSNDFRIGFHHNLNDAPANPLTEPEQETVDQFHNRLIRYRNGEHSLDHAQQLRSRIITSASQTTEHDSASSEDMRDRQPEDLSKNGQQLMDQIDLYEADRFVNSHSTGSVNPQEIEDLNRILQNVLRIRGRPMQSFTSLSRYDLLIANLDLLRVGHILDYEELSLATINHEINHLEQQRTLLRSRENLVNIISSYTIRLQKIRIEKKKKMVRQANTLTNLITNAVIYEHVERPDFILNPASDNSFQSLLSRLEELEKMENDLRAGSQNPVLYISFLEGARFARDILILQSELQQVDSSDETPDDKIIEDWLNRMLALIDHCDLLDETEKKLRQLLSGYLEELLQRYTHIFKKHRHRIPAY